MKKDEKAKILCQNGLLIKFSLLHWTADVDVSLIAAVVGQIDVFLAQRTLRNARRELPTVILTLMTLQLTLQHRILTRLTPHEVLCAIALT